MKWVCLCTLKLDYRKGHFLFFYEFLKRDEGLFSESVFAYAKMGLFLFIHRRKEAFYVTDKEIKFDT